MAGLKEIRSRIASTKNTQQITKAMKLVSAAKLRKAQQNIQNMRPYALALQKVIADIAVTERVSHPLLERPQNTKSVLLVVLTSDRGLCGAFNTNINRAAESIYRELNGKLETLDFFFIGKRGWDYFKRRSVEPVDTITKLDRDVSYELAAGVAEKLIEQFKSGKYDEIRMVYNEFKSAISQQVVCETLLPIDMEKQSFPPGEDIATFAKDMIFEPSPEELIDQLLEKHFALQVYRSMSESVAAEHGARMTSMENATKNASEMIDSLSLTYNNLRQAAITTELTEITSGAEALK